MLGFVQITDSHTLRPQIEIIQKKKLFISSIYTCKNFEIPNLKTSKFQKNHPTSDQVVDIFTKPLPKEIFEYL